MLEHTRQDVSRRGLSLSLLPSLSLSLFLFLSSSCNRVVPVRPVWSVRTTLPFWLNQLHCYKLISLCVCVCVACALHSASPTSPGPSHSSFFFPIVLVMTWLRIWDFGKLPPTFINILDKSLAFLVVTKATHPFVCCVGKCWWSSLRVGVRRGYTGWHRDGI